MSATRFCELVGCSLPLQQAAMSRIATPALAAAVSNAGGLGMLAAGRARPDEVQRAIEATAALTDRPFGVGFIVPFLDRANLEIAVARVRVVELFYGWPDADLVPDGVVCGWQVGSVDEAKAAVDAGCQFIVIQGVEAGGHVRSTQALARLLPAVREAVDTRIAVVAAGGIGTAEDALAAFELGADAVRVGTRFVAAEESDAHRDYVERLVDAGPDDTVFTEVFEVGWPNAPHRVLRSCVAQVLADGAPDPIGHLGSTPLPRRGPTPPSPATTGAIDAMALYAGSSVGAVTGRQPAAEIVRDLVGERVSRR